MHATKPGRTSRMGEIPKSPKCCSKVAQASLGVVVGRTGTGTAQLPKMQAQIEPIPKRALSKFGPTSVEVQAPIGLVNGTVKQPRHLRSDSARCAPERLQTSALWQGRSWRDLRAPRAVGTWHVVAHELLQERAVKHRSAQQAAVFCECSGECSQSLPA